MADTRAADDPVDALAQLQQQVADMQTTLNARASRSPTGTLEPTFLPAAKADTLLCNGATINRADYPGLFQWASDNGLVGSVFGNGDGTTTFALPDMRGAVLRMPAAGGTVGEKLGADTKVLTTANLPAHDHNVSVANHSTHTHTFTTGAAGGNHGNHNSGSHTAASALPGSQDYFFAGADNVQVGNSAHSHSGTTDAASLSAHSVTEASVGSGTALDIRQASFGINILIWT